jgi:chromosome partitioning protein
MQITGSLNQKGGVGKTAIAVGVGGALAERGRRVLLADVDPQGHLTVTALRMPRVPLDEPSLAAALAGVYDGPVRQLVVRHSSTPAGGVLDVLPSSTRMFTAPRDLDKRGDRERQLGRLLDELAEDYDHVIIDPPPALDILTDNVLAASDGMLIPVEPDDSSIEALRLLLGQIRGLERELRLSPITLHGLVLSHYRTPLATIDRTVVSQLQAIKGLDVLAELPLAVAVKESWRAGVPLPLHQPGHPHADQFRRLADVLDQAAGLEIPARAATELAAP